MRKENSSACCDSQVFQKTQFKNGLTLVSERVSGAQGLSIGFWIKVGSRYEQMKERGVSHFLEHMLFKGLKKGQKKISALEIAKTIENVGGEFNASTGKEFTCLEIYCLKRDYRLSLQLLSDVLLYSDFPVGELAQERQVILQEMAMVEETPDELAYDLYLSMTFKGHPVGMPILGDRNLIQKMSRKQMLGFFHRHYIPRNIVISVAGDVSHQVLKKEISRMLTKKWPGRQGSLVSLLSVKDEVLPEFTPGKYWVEHSSEQAHLIWGVPGLRLSDENRYAAYLLDLYLGGGMSSMLFQEIREKRGLAYSVGSSEMSFTEIGLFTVYVATRPDRVQQCLRLIEKCVRSVAEKKLTARQLKDLKSNAVGAILLDSESLISKMESIADDEMIFGRRFTIQEEIKKIESVSSSEIQKLAQRLFEKTPRSILVLGPTQQEKFEVVRIQSSQNLKKKRKKRSVRSA